FKDELVTMVTELTRKVINEKAKIITFKDESKPTDKEKTIRKATTIVWENETCPKCSGEKLMKGKTAVGCSNFKGCGFKLPFIIFGKKLTEKQLHDVIMKGKSSKLKGFSEHPDQVTEGVLRLSEFFLAELTAE
ncbi:MAG: DNA topoisomerase III, partial [Chryseobacterium sp.]|nr:DNA topoisomerase III [Chryseobacterium sp.]